MAYMTSIWNRKSHYSVSYIRQCEYCGDVCVHARSGLHIHMLGAEKTLRKFQSERFHLVNELAALVKTLSYISFCVAVREI